MSDEDEQDTGSCDDTFAADIHDFHTLLRTRDHEGLVSALENPDLYRLACDDPRYSELAMQGIAVLAWAEPPLASELLVRFDTDRSRENPSSFARRAARSLMAALEWRQLEADGDGPLGVAELLREFLRLYPALAEDGEHASNLREDLRARPRFYADLSQYLHRRAEVLPLWIEGLVDHRPIASTGRESDTAEVIKELSAAQRDALVSAISELRSSLRASMQLYLVWIVAAALVIFLPTAAGAILGLLVVGASFAFGEGRAYQSVVRPRLIRLAIEHGVGARQVVSSIYRMSGKAGKVGNFDIKIENDHALDLLAALSHALAPGVEQPATSLEQP